MGAATVEEGVEAAEQLAVDAVGWSVHKTNINNGQERLTQKTNGNTGSATFATT